jgi:excisionase family DNA binding protein
LSKSAAVNEVAEQLRCSRWGVYAMAKDGRLASVRLSSRRLLFTPAAVEEAVRKAERRGETASAAK